MILSQHRPGVSPGEDGAADILLWAPHARKVGLHTPEGKPDWSFVQDEYGYWRLHTSLLKAGDRYKFLLDDSDPLPDPASLSQPEGVHGWSAVIDLKAFTWTDEKWTPPPLRNWIFYELHTGTFTNEGTFAALEEKLVYLKDLGITAVELMPVAQFPGARNWGYDGVYPYAVHHAYGGAIGLQRMVDACHRTGLAVVLDVVYNHLGPEGNYLPAYGPYFTDKYCTPWGKAVNSDDAWCDGFRHYMIQNALMWFRDFHIDGLRLDAVHAIKDFSADHVLSELRRAVDDLVLETGRSHYLIVECDLNDPRYISPIDTGGYGMHSQWNDEFHHALRVAAGQERNGYYADFNGLAHLAKAYRDAYVYDGQYSQHRHRRFGKKVQGNPGEQFVVFSQNHDQVGNRMLGERSSSLYSFEMLKLLAGAVLVSPFLPLLFMGEEWGAPSPFLYFVSHEDAALVEAVRKGRKEEFTAFHAGGDPPDPQAETTFLQSKLPWQLMDKEPHATLFQYYRAMIRLRKENTALASGDRDKVDVHADVSAGVLYLDRSSDRQHIRCVLNFSKAVRTVKPFSGIAAWRRLADSADPDWNGNSSAPVTATAGTSLLIQPQSLLVYAQETI